MSKTVGAASLEYALRRAFPNRPDLHEPREIIDRLFIVEYETFNDDSQNPREADQHEAVGKILSVHYDQSVNGLVFETTVTRSGTEEIKTIDYLLGQERWNIDIDGEEGIPDNSEVRFFIF